MTRAQTIGSRPLLYLLLTIDLAMGAVYVADFALGHPLGSLSQFIDLDRETNPPTWYSSIQLFAIGLLFALLAVVERFREGDGVPSYPIGYCVGSRPRLRFSRWTRSPSSMNTWED